MRSLLVYSSLWNDNLLLPMCVCLLLLAVGFDELLGVNEVVLSLRLARLAFLLDPLLSVLTNAVLVVTLAKDIGQHILLPTLSLAIVLCLRNGSHQIRFK
jgi:hypothetical protein